MPRLSSHITTHSLPPARPRLFLALPVSFRLRRLLTPVSISSDQVVIAARPMHLGAPSLIMVSVSPCGLTRMRSAARPSDAPWRQVVLAKSQHRVSLPRASRAYERTPKTQHTKPVATTSAAGADRGRPMAVPRMAKRTSMPKRTVVSAKAITRWGASDKVIIILARARCSFPATPCFGSRML